MKHVLQQVTLLLVLTFLLPAKSRAKDILVILSGKHAVFESISIGAKKVGDNVTTLNTNEAARIRGHLSRMPSDAGIIAVGVRAWEIAKDQGSSFSKVYCSYGSAVREGIQDKNLILDVSTPLPEYLTLLRASLPDARKIAVLHKQQLDVEWTLQGRMVKSFQIQAWNRLKQVTDDALAWADAIWLPTDPEFTSTALAFIIKQALRKRKPVFTSSPRIIRGGALAGLTRDPEAIGAYAVKWLKNEVDGNDSSSYPPSKLVVNDKVAKFLGVSLNK